MEMIKYFVFFTIFAALAHSAAQARTEAPEESAPPQPAEAKVEGEEVIVDLDGLEEDESGPVKNDGVPDEPLHPIATASVELEKKSYLRVVALAILLPVAAMLPRARRGRRKRPALAGDHSPEKGELRK